MVTIESHLVNTVPVVFGFLLGMCCIMRLSILSLFSGEKD